jgi:hypothetical protein
MSQESFSGAAPRYPSLKPIYVQREPAAYRYPLTGTNLGVELRDCKEFREVSWLHHES